MSRARLRTSSVYLDADALDHHRARQHSGPIAADERCRAFLDSIDNAVGDDRRLLYDPRDPIFILHTVGLEIAGDLGLASARPLIYDPGFVVTHPKLSRVEAEKSGRLKEAADRETDCDRLSLLSQLSESSDDGAESDSDDENDETIDPIGGVDNFDGLCDSMRLMNVLSPHGSLRAMLASLKV